MSIFSSPKCLYCHGEMKGDIGWTTFFLREDERLLCETCRGKLERIGGETCPICHRPLEGLDPQYRKDGICFDCHRWETSKKWQGVLRKNISLYHYNDFMAEVIARFKYRGDYVLAKIFSKEIQRALQSVEYDLVVPIPLSKVRLMERGFNQSEALAWEAGITPQSILTRIHSEKQSKKSRTERIHLPHVFSVQDPETAVGKTVLLIDDIYTTGSTLRHAAYALKQVGAKTILSLTVARG